MFFRVRMPQNCSVFWARLSKGTKVLEQKDQRFLYIYIYYAYNHVYLFILDFVLSLFLTFSQPSINQIVLFASPKEIQGEVLWWHDGDDSHILPFLLGNDPICCVQRKWQVVTCCGSHFSAHLLVFLGNLKKHPTSWRIIPGR